MALDISATAGAAYRKVVSCSYVAVILSDQAGKNIVPY